MVLHPHSCEHSWLTMVKWNRKSRFCLVHGKWYKECAPPRKNIMICVCDVGNHQTFVQCTLILVGDYWSIYLSKVNYSTTRVRLGGSEQTTKLRPCSPVPLPCIWLLDYNGITSIYGLSCCWWSSNLSWLVGLRVLLLDIKIQDCQVQISFKVTRKG